MSNENPLQRELDLEKSRGAFEIAPAGMRPALITVVADLGVRENGYGNRRQMLGLAFELGGLKTKTGSPFAVFEGFTASLHEKGKLHPVIRAALGSVPEDEMDPADLLGKPLYLEVVHREDSQGKIWANVGAVLPLPAGTPTPETETSLLFFDLENENPAVFQKLPALFRKRIEKRVEVEPAVKGPEPVAADSDPDDDINF